MNVRTLIAQLQRMNPDAEVHLAYNSRDHWRTELAPVVERVEDGEVEHSAYHDADAVVNRDGDCGDADEQDDRREDLRGVVILRSA